MTTWIITGLLALIIASMIYTERKCGRRTEKFFKEVAPQIDQLGRDVAEKYRQKYGREPTGPFPIPPAPASTQPKKRWWSRLKKTP